MTRRSLAAILLVLLVMRHEGTRSPADGPGPG